MGRLAFALVLTGALLLPSVAAAQEQAAPPASAQSSAAETLFIEARQLLAQGKREEACKKFDESYRVDTSALGTLFNLGLCNERLGRIATAWLQFREVTARSRTTRPDRAELAEKRAADLEPRLSKLRIVVPPAILEHSPGLEVTLDGVVIPAASYGTALPVDGGEHVVAARAKDRAPASVTVKVEAERGAAEATIPELEVLPPTEEPPPPAPPSAPSTPTVALVLGAAGIASLAVGTGFGISVLTQADAVDDRSLSLEERKAKYRELDPQAYLADGAIALGVVLVGVSAVLLLTNKGSSPKSPAAALVLPLRAASTGLAF